MPDESTDAPPPATLESNEPESNEPELVEEDSSVEGRSRWRYAPNVVAAAASAVLVLACAAYVLRYTRAMANTSLWTDELFTTRHFTSDGPLNAITNYKTANNHVFHSLLTSILPGDPRSPLRARFWPIAFTGATFLIVVVHFARRRQFLAGSLLVYGFAINVAWLDLNMQSRGYGPLALMALLTALGVKRFLETDRAVYLWLVTVPVVLGTWALPSYLFFAAPMLVGLLAITRSRKVLIHAVAAAAAVLLTYLPILSDLVKATRNYAEEFGGENFTSLNQVGASFTTYLFQATGFGRFWWVAVAAVGISAVAVLGLRWAGRPAILFAVLMFGSAVAFYGICLLLRTPILRTTAFVMWPVASAAATLVGEATRRARHPIPIALATVVLVALLTPNAVSKTRGFTFTPLENWQTTTRYIAAIVPDGSSVYGTWSPEYADDYLSDRFTVVRKPNPALFAAGRLVILDQPRPKTNPPDVSASPYSAVIETKQRRFGFQKLILPAPPDARVGKVVLDGVDETVAVTDRDPATGLSVVTTRAGGPVELSIAVDGSAPTRSVVIGASSFPNAFRVDARLADGTTIRLSGAQVIRQEGVVVVLLGDRQVTSVTIGVEPTRSANALSVEEIWSLPSVLPAL